ncbi:acyl-CoA dehydrogenase family protein [Roseicella sp. DB1501]|uniref:acyl-CoA dehydrogenase family protein n=1 Tax=Roseicella sp. DB1501 TaxID=2730925 RepID=UPI00149105D4|nr:acyl-CoA dehydrogenase family protein [Roseicella sp. DB1501]NOG72292.1 acyl-CoA/acyl-ACP dehydrogenase [Roseicella sp. DB1501]
MHPGVLAFWRDTGSPKGDATAWEAQKRLVFETTLAGAWWGTITSEPGSGGDVGRTRASARPDPGAPGGWRVTGEKHFGSGSGVTSYMITTALPEGEAEPAWFFLAVHGVAWDGSTGMTLRAEWDGFGMAATDSHAFAFRDFPATRFAWPGHWREVIEGTGGSTTMFQVAVILGVTDAAMAHVQRLLRAREAAAVTAFDKVEWVAAEREAWLIRQAYEAGLRALERHGRARRETSMAKASIALLAESLLTRLCRIAGGGAYARRSPLGHWFEDVRAMGFLRPPWSLALEGLYALGRDAEPYQAPV